MTEPVGPAITRRPQGVMRPSTRAERRRRRERTLGAPRRRYRYDARLLFWLLRVLRAPWSYRLNADIEDHAEYEYAAGLTDFLGSLAGQ